MSDKSIASLEQFITHLRRILPILREKYAVQTLEIFGSYARGEARQTSDLDLLVTFSEPPTLFQFVELENYLSDLLEVEVDLVMKDSLKPIIGKRILEQAREI